MAARAVRWVGLAGALTLALLLGVGTLLARREASR